MAIVSLGTRTLSIGGLPQEYSSFVFRDSKAYLIKATSTIELPENVYSEYRIRGIFTNPNNFSVYTHHLISLPITERESTFLLPFSDLYDGDGSVVLEVERIPFVFGTGDSAGEVTLNLEYDDSNSARTWL